MGYEVKLFVVTPYYQMKDAISKRVSGGFTLVYQNEEGNYYGYEEDGNTKVDVTGEIIERCYSQVIGMVDICKPGYASNIYSLLKNSPVTNLFFYNDNHIVVEDSYGEFLKESSLEEAVVALEQDMVEDSYRRFDIALAFLKACNEYFKDAKVLFYGY